MENRLMNNRVRLLTFMQPKLTVALLGLFATGAFAQEAPVEEVIVTAQKVAQPASKTPVSLTAISGDALRAAGAVDATALTALAPSIQMGNQGGKLEIAIRGVSSLDGTEKGDPSASFNIDGAYIGRPEAQVGSFFDLERVEVLRGPQGTLYGRNSTAGAINLITNKPSDKLQGSFDVDVGNHNDRRVDAMLNVPVNQSLAFRAAISSNQRDTFLNPGPNTVPLQDQDNLAARLHALLTFSSDTSLLLTYEHSHIGGKGASPLPITNFFSGTPLSNGNDLANPVYVDRGSATQLTAANKFIDANNHTNNSTNAFRSEFKTTLGPVDLTYQFATLRSSLDEADNGTYFGFPLYSSIAGQSSQKTNELRFNSTGDGPLKWVAGVYMFSENINRDTTYFTQTPGPLIAVPFLPVVHNRSKAAFGQVTYSLQPDLRFTVGLRTTHDQKYGSDPLAGSATGPGYTAGVSSSKINYRLGAEYDLSKAVMLYGSLSTGYKAGGYNDTDGSHYKPETLTSTEIGIKGRFLDNKLRLSADVFNYSYKDLQLTSVVCAAGSAAANCGSDTTNAANASVQGIEAEGLYSFNASNKVNFGLSLLRSKFKDYNPTLTTSWAGEKLDRSPSSLLLGYTHILPLNGGGDLNFHIGTHFSSSYYISDPSVAVRYTQPSYHKTDLSFTYTSPGDTYHVQAYVRNLENTITIESFIPSSFYVGDPRTFGVRVGAAF